jgi:hypothetical protein
VSWVRTTTKYFYKEGETDRIRDEIAEEGNAPCGFMRYSHGAWHYSNILEAVNVVD